MRAREILRPMLASLSAAPLDDPEWVYEPKYDGIRAIAEVAGGRSGGVHLWSRLGNEKTSQFPEVAAALAKWGRTLKAPVVLDGEIVALDPAGQPTGFQQLQGRIHLADGADAPGARVAYMIFDLLKDGATDLRESPLSDRRAALERLLHATGSPLLRISEQVRGEGMAMYARAMANGWEGLIAKVAKSPYKSGKRTPDWRKVKIVQEQEFVVGGWTEPRHSREYFGALLLGYYEQHAPSEVTRRGRLQPARDPGALIYAGHTGTGFNEKELARVMKLLKPLETTTCPFAARPKTNERAHWVEPKLVAEVKFTEWTADGKLRHPVYLGLRDDKKPEDVHRETTSRVAERVGADLRVRPADPHVGPGAAGRVGADLRVRPADPRVGPGAAGRVGADLRVRPADPRARRTDSRARRSQRAAHAGASAVHVASFDELLDQLRALEDSRRDATIALPDGETLSVGNLHKIFWPKNRFTKGDLLRYYVQVAGCVLPAVDSRPLVMKRFPNGIGGKAFYQQRAPEDVPPGVRVEKIKGDEVPSRIVGGSLETLLYMTQLAAISQDPWFSRAETPNEADHVALDLDPSEGVRFAQVLEVARWIHDELEWLGASAFPKTSGADGLHIYIPLPPHTPYDAGLLFCQIVATVVAQKHPRAATIERAVRARGRRVYIDYLQNIRGKTLATAYSARASEYAGASTPVTWAEVHDGFDREDFTIETLPARIKRVGDLWSGLRSSKGVDLSKVARYTEAGRVRD